MKNTKLFRLLSSLSNEERAAFKLWYARNTQDRNTSTSDLLAFLLKAVGQHKRGQLEKARVFASVYPGRQFSGDYLRKQTYVLFQALKTWLVSRRVNSGLEQDIGFLQELQHRKLDRDFQLLSDQIAGELAKTEQRDTHYFWMSQVFNRERDIVFGRMQERRYDPAIQEQSKALDRYFIIQKLRLACEMRNRNRIIEAKYEAAFLPEISHLIQSSDEYIEEPAIAIYWQVWQTLQDNSSTQDYLRLVELLANHPKVFDAEELREIYRYAQNFCIRKINEGKPEFKSHLLTLYQYQLERDLFL
ncbi:MAG: hypothetical protein AAFP08_12390 [Bacteroidota bacterium]